VASRKKGAKKEQTRSRRVSKRAAKQQKEQQKRQKLELENLERIAVAIAIEKPLQNTTSNCERQASAIGRKLEHFSASPAQQEAREQLETSLDKHLLELN